MLYVYNEKGELVDQIFEDHDIEKMNNHRDLWDKLLVEIQTHPRKVTLKEEEEDEVQEKNNEEHEEEEEDEEYEEEDEEDEEEEDESEADSYDEFGYRSTNEYKCEDPNCSNCNSNVSDTEGCEDMDISDSESSEDNNEDDVESIENRKNREKNVLESEDIMASMANYKTDKLRKYFLEKELDLDLEEITL